MIDSLALWRFDCRARDAMAALPFPGQVLRAALGAAIRHRTCDRDCPDGAPCLRGTGCDYHDAFEPDDKRPRYRVDAVDLQDRALERGEPWSLRVLTVGDPAVLRRGFDDALFRGLGPDRAGHRVVTVEPLVHGGDDAPVGTLDLQARAAELVGSVYIHLASPTHLLRASRFIAAPTLDDVLRACLLRAGALRITGRPLEPAAGFTVESRVVRWKRWAARQGQEVPMEGVVGTWRAVVDEAQAHALALGEAAGIGKHVTMGLGTVRVEPVGRRA